MTAKPAGRRVEHVPVPAKPICGGASPRAPARGLLVVIGHRLETPAQRAVATRGLGIGRCNEDMGGAENLLTGRAMEPKTQDRWRLVLHALHPAAVFCDQQFSYNTYG